MTGGIDDDDDVGGGGDVEVDGIGDIEVDDVIRWCCVSINCGSVINKYVSGYLWIYFSLSLSF